VIGHDVVVVGERHLANGALSVLLNYLSIEQLPHLRFGAKLVVSPGVVRVFDVLQAKAPDPAFLLDQLAAAARERPMNGTVLNATEFHGFPPGWAFREKRDDVQLPVYLNADRIPSTPERFSYCPSQLADVPGLVNVSR
jgi:hypothetical protein